MAAAARTRKPGIQSETESETVASCAVGLVWSALQNVLACVARKYYYTTCTSS